jgi:hypothetical protein
MSGFLTLGSLTFLEGGHCSQNRPGAVGTSLCGYPSETMMRNSGLSPGRGNPCIRIKSI